VVNKNFVSKKTVLIQSTPLYVVVGPKTRQNTLKEKSKVIMKKMYEYSCYDCEIIWEIEYDWGKCDTKTKCPQCNKECEQNWLNRKAPPVHFKGPDWN